MRNWWGLSLVCVLAGCDGELAQSGDETGVVAETSPADTSTADTSTAEDSSADSVDSAVVDSSSDSTTTDSAKPDAPAGCTGLHGGAMVNVGSYCIDKYEVTNEDYNLFLDAPAAERANIAGCGWNTEFGTALIDPVVAKRPRANVDWCDAQAYCKWAGKRLCGKIGGGSATYVLYADATKSEWMNACSGGGTQTYTYAGGYDSSICQTASGGLVDVGSRPSCHGTASPYDAIYDLTGNVAEWEDSCEIQPPLETTLCRGRGGGTGDGEVLSKCAESTAVTAAKGKYAGLGFRCCKTP